MAFFLDPRESHDRPTRPNGEHYCTGMENEHYRVPEGRPDPLRTATPGDLLCAEIRDIRYVS